MCVGISFTHTAISTDWVPFVGILSKYILARGFNSCINAAIFFYRVLVQVSQMQAVCYVATEPEITIIPLLALVIGMGCKYYMNCLIRTYQTSDLNEVRTTVPLTKNRIFTVTQVITFWWARVGFVERADPERHDPKGADDDAAIISPRSLLSASRSYRIIRDITLYWSCNRNADLILIWRVKCTPWWLRTGERGQIPA